MHLVYPPKCCKTLVFDFSWNDLPCEQRFLSCMALSVYKVIRLACLSRGWFVYSSGVKRKTSASRLGMTVISRRNWKQWLHVCKIDLFTDTAAILNLLDLKSIIGCPGGTRSVFTCTFRPKRELQSIFLRKKAIVITSKDGTMISFSHYNFCLGKLKEKLARKARINTDASIWDLAHAPWASHNTP